MRWSLNYWLYHRNRPLVMLKMFTSHLAEFVLFSSNFVPSLWKNFELFRILSCFKLNPFEYLNLPFEASPEDLKKQYRKVTVFDRLEFNVMIIKFIIFVSYSHALCLIHVQLSLLVHPDKCKHPQAKEAFAGKLVVHNILHGLRVWILWLAYFLLAYGFSIYKLEMSTFALTWKDFNSNSSSSAVVLTSWV